MPMAFILTLTMSKATTLPAKRSWQLKHQINMGEENCIPLLGMESYLPFYIISRSI